MAVFIPIVGTYIAAVVPLVVAFLTVGMPETLILLTASFLSGIAQNPAVPPKVVSRADVELAAGAPFISDADLETAMAEAGVDDATAQAVLDANERARLDGLRSALALLALLAVVALFFTKQIPTRQPGRVQAIASPP